MRLRKTVQLGLVVVGVLILGSTSAMAEHEETGLCNVLFDTDLYACADDLTNQECLFWAAGFESGLGTTWNPSGTCADLSPPRTWDGACYVPDATEEDGGPVCAVVDADGAGAAQAACEGGDDTTWFDALECPEVPALPASGNGLLIVILLAGALVVLKLRF
jgi:hypothetical protein